MKFAPHAFLCLENQIFYKQYRFNFLCHMHIKRSNIFFPDGKVIWSSYDHSVCWKVLTFHTLVCWTGFSLRYSDGYVSSAHNFVSLVHFNRRRKNPHFPSHHELGAKDIHISIILYSSIWCDVKLLVNGHLAGAKMIKLNSTKHTLWL